ncbi:hypothetical protein EDB84DRAFT_394998 [Lactarius hengduanensis]|nr:hypothetical protein EDB84DRAFT_394998 [Lactarius hengduanensis]
MAVHATCFSATCFSLTRFLPALGYRTICSSTSLTTATRSFCLPVIKCTAPAPARPGWYDYAVHQISSLLWRGNVQFIESARRNTFEINVFMGLVSRRGPESEPDSDDPNEGVFTYQRRCPFSMDPDRNECYYREQRDTHSTLLVVVSSVFLIHSLVMHHAS